MKWFASVLSVLALAAMAGVVQAETITVSTGSSSFAVSSSDVPGTGATFTGGGWTGSVAKLHDADSTEAAGGGGSYERGETEGQKCGLGPDSWHGYDVFVGVAFDLTDAPLGWDITQITTYASWPNNPPGDPGRSRQGYSLTATLMDDSTVQVLASQTYVDATDIIATKVDITGLTLTGVKALRFDDFPTAPVGDPGNLYHEFDIFGTATVPEPGAIALLTAGLIGLLAYAWRKRK